MTPADVAAEAKQAPAPGLATAPAAAGPPARGEYPGGTLVPHEVPLGVALEMDDVRRIARDEVVHPHHLVPGGEQAVAEMGAEEPRGAGYEDAHGRPMLS